MTAVARAPRRLLARALVVVTLSILAHALVMTLGRRSLEFPSFEFPTGATIEARLITAPPVTVEPQPIPAPAPRLRAPRAVVAAPPIVQTEPVTEAASPPPAPAQEPRVDSTTEPVIGPSAAGDASASSERPVNDASTIAADFDASGAPLLAELAGPQAQRAELPGSARFVYHTTDTRFAAVTGTTTVHWRFDEDRRYAARLVTTVLGLTVLELSSRGRVHEFGLAPDHYTEKTISRSEWSTRFDWGERRVLFSSRNVERELREGVQDRLSFQFQLMVLGQRMSNRFRPGSSMSLPIGARNDLAVYRFSVGGEERLQTGIGMLSTVKLERPAGPRASDSRIEVWLAPDIGWLPVKLRFTDRHEQVTENVLSEMAVPAE